MKGQSRELWAHWQHSRHYVLNNDLLAISFCMNQAAGSYAGKKIFPVVIPSDRKDIIHEIFLWSHVHPTAGHFGQQSTMLRINERFFWVNSTEEVWRFVAECGECVAKRQKVDAKDCIHNAATKSGYPMETLYIDLVRRLPEQDGKSYILVCQDSFTKDIWAFPIANK